MEDQNIQTYVEILIKSLDSKLQVMKRLEEFTKEQEKILAGSEPDMQYFDHLMDEKEEQIGLLTNLDQGFETVFVKIKKVLEKEKVKYRPQIEKLHDKIRNITDISVTIQAVEHRNRDKLEAYLTGQKKEIKNFKVSSQTASNYYKNMANQHQNGQSYFLNKKS